MSVRMNSVGRSPLGVFAPSSLTTGMIQSSAGPHFGGAVRGYPLSLLAAGDFGYNGASPANARANRIASFRGKQWSQMPIPMGWTEGGGIETLMHVHKFHLLRPGSLSPGKSRILAGGLTTVNAMNDPDVNALQELTPSGWRTFAGGVYNANGSPIVRDICEFQGDLYVIGEFTSAGGPTGSGVPTPTGIARWDGEQWHHLNHAHFTHEGASGLQVGAVGMCMVAGVFNEEPALFVGCRDNHSGVVQGIASPSSTDIQNAPLWSGVLVWDGEQWHGLPSGGGSGSYQGVSGTASANSKEWHVLALAWYDEKLVIGGWFDVAGNLLGSDGGGGFQPDVVNCVACDPDAEIWYAMQPLPTIVSSVAHLFVMRGNLYHSQLNTQGERVMHWASGVWSSIAGTHQGGSHVWAHAMTEHPVMGSPRLVIGCTMTSATEDCVLWYDEATDELHALDETLATSDSGNPYVRSLLSLAPRIDNTPAKHAITS